MVALFLSSVVHAENDDKCTFSVGADMVSTYVWRGSYQAGISIQPAMDFSTGGFSIGTWGSVDGFAYKEVDLTASYSFKNITAGLFNYWVSWEGSYDYFDFSSSTAHLLEAYLVYSFDPFPLTLGWNTIIAGDDKYLDKNGKSKRVFSTYLEATYAFRMKDVKMEAAAGASLWKSHTFYTPYHDGGKTDRFAVINLSLMASRDININDGYSLGVFGQLIFNPAKEDAFFVLGIKF